MAKPLDIKTDKLMQDILRFLREPERGRVTTAYIVSRFYRSPAADSNHPKYRAVLTRLNWLYREGYIDAAQPNRYTPTRWFKK